MIMKLTCDNNKLEHTDNFNLYHRTDNLNCGTVLCFCEHFGWFYTLQFAITSLLKEAILLKGNWRQVVPL